MLDFRSIMLAAGVTLVSTAALAQAGGADVPGNSKAQGARDNGASSTGTRGSGSSATSGSGRGTSTGGNSGGAAGRN